LVTTDERGVTRQTTPGAACDAGAFEGVGATPVSSSSVSSSSVSVERVYGTTADATAATELSHAFLGTCPGTTGNRPVVLATDQTYADALASAYLAKDLGTGTLLTPTSTLSVATRAELQLEGITHVYVVGGPLAVSPAVVATLSSTPADSCGGTSPTGSDLQVTRIAGATAATTAAKVAAFVGAGFVGTADLASSYKSNGAFNTTSGISSASGPGGAVPTAIVASDREFQDAEGGAVLSYAADLPILLATPTAVPAATTQAIGSLGIRQVVLLGGPLAVSTAVVAGLQAAGVSVLRVAGADYMGTSVELAKLETASSGAHSGFGWDTRTGGLAVARGNGFEDGLAGADLAARGYHGSGPVPIVLTESQSTIGSDLASYLRDVGSHGIGSPATRVAFLMVLGGPEALSSEIVRTMAANL
jgi:putative cell wall-binding protein